MTQGFWEDAARKDPLWAILSHPSKKDRGWSTDEFFATGRREISLLLHHLRALGVEPRMGRALDFGCGVGRLSQALAPAFESVVGVDISPTMLQFAERLNQWPQRVRYVRGADEGLGQFDSASFDFIYSDVVLQHMTGPVALGYVRDFVRVLAPGGIAVFQLTSERRPIPEAALSPMPDDGYRCSVTVDGLPASMTSGASADLIVTVRNESPVDWDRGRFGAFRVGNHWLAPSGDMIVQDDGRTMLPPGVAPGAQHAVALSITAPGRGGEYVCEIDVVHEGVTWFADRGARAFRSRVRVTGDAPAAPGIPALQSRDAYPDIRAWLPDDGAIGDFPMFGVPRDEVLAAIAQAGARCFHIEPDERGGPEWSGYSYFISR